MKLLVGTAAGLLVVTPRSGEVRGAEWPAGGGPSCLAAHPRQSGRAWAGAGQGIFRSDDGGLTWRARGLEGEQVTAVAVSPVEPDLVWAGTEPSAVWRSTDGGDGWERAEGLLELASAPTWSFPPRPDTHHVRWIACHPADAGRLWVAIEAGALVTTRDGGGTWQDRTPGGPHDTHELAIHADRPLALRSAAGDGYFESTDGGATWSSPEEGLEVGYLRSAAVDPGAPDVVVVSAAPGPYSTYVAGRAEGRVYRREGGGPWERVVDGFPDPPATIAPLLLAGREAGELWAADERGVHRSGDGGRSWRQVARVDDAPERLTAFTAVA